MKTYLELEGKLGNQPHTYAFLPNTNSLPRKTPEPKKTEKKRRTKASVKRRFKRRVIAQPRLTTPTLPMNPIPLAEPTPTVATSTVTTQTPVAKSAATTIPLTVYNLAEGQFKGIPYPITKFQEEGPSTPSCNNPQEQQPEATIAAATPQSREDTPWPNTMPASINMFNTRALWPIQQLLRWRRERFHPR